MTLCFWQVCREFQRGTCSRPTSECRYAHPADHIVVDAADNHVTVCMDFVKSKCTRELCKYFHPPSHLQALVRAAHARSQQAACSNNPNNSALVGARRECSLLVHCHSKYRPNISFVKIATFSFCKVTFGNP